MTGHGEKQPKAASTWALEGRCQRDRLRETWRKTVERERWEMRFQFKGAWMLVHELRMEKLKTSKNTRPHAVFPFQG